MTYEAEAAVQGSFCSRLSPGPDLSPTLPNRNALFVPSPLCVLSRSVSHQPLAFHTSAFITQLPAPDPLTVLNGDGSAPDFPAHRFPAFL